MSEFITSSYVYKRLFNYWIICCRGRNAFAALFWHPNVIASSMMRSLLMCMNACATMCGITMSLGQYFVFLCVLSVHFWLFPSLDEKLTWRNSHKIKHMFVDMAESNTWWTDDLSMLCKKNIGIVFEIKLEIPMNKKFLAFSAICVFGRTTKWNFSVTSKCQRMVNVFWHFIRITTNVIRSKALKSCYQQSCYWNLFFYEFFLIFIRILFMS